MIYENLAAQDYEQQILFSSTPTQTGQAVGVTDSCTIDWTWGNQWFDGGIGSFVGHGIRITLSHHQTPPAVGAVSTTYATIAIPFLDQRVSVTFPGAWTDVTSLLQINGATLTTDCSTWTIAWTSLIWSVNGVVKLSLGAGSTNGSSYDRRDNRFYVEVGGGADVVTVPTWPGCDRILQETSVTGYAYGGWRHKVAGVWTNEPISILSITDPSLLVDICDCEYSCNPPSASPSDCWHVTIPFDATTSITEVDNGHISCICVPTGLKGTFTDLSRILTVRGRQNSIAIEPTDGGITRTSRTQGYRCYSNLASSIPAFTIITTTATEANTKAAYRSDVDNMIGTRHCALPVSAPHCPVNTGEDPGNYTCSLTAPNFCAWHGYIEVGWPTRPDCGSGCNGGQHLTVAPQDGILYSTCADGSTVQVRRWNLLGLNSWFTVHTGSPTSAQSAWHPYGNLRCFYHDSGTTYVRDSFDRAATWSSAVAITTGTNPAPAVDYRNGISYCAIHDGTQFRLWRQLTPSASWTAISNIITTAASQAGLEVQGDAHNRLVFTVNDAGTVKQYASYDQGGTWVAL